MEMIKLRTIITDIKDSLERREEDEYDRGKHK